jgi:hypothetical protein
LGRVEGKVALAGGQAILIQQDVSKEEGWKRTIGAVS